MSDIRTYIRGCIIFFLFLLNSALYAETFRVLVKDKIRLDSDTPSGASVSLAYNDSVLIFLQQDMRFIRGVEFELTAPQAWLAYEGGVAFGLYSNLDKIPGTFPVDIECTQLFFEPIPPKIQTVYQIPLRAHHGLRGTPYLTLFRTPVLPESFPLLFRLTPIVKSWSKELEGMRFQLNVKPIFSDEGILIVNVQRPEFLPNGSYTALIDEQAIGNLGSEIFIKEGEHNLTLLSSDYRAEKRRFVIERGKTLILSIMLHDLTPLVIFEAPENARIFIDNTPILRTDIPLAVDPGMHDIRIQVSDYTVMKTAAIEKGKTYRIAIILDMRVSEE
ncbi:MAG: PEGA domain-containing protein [Spirochaetaceae bacterium]|jgi:hypothetical protein|nr:PEGA domain-containing protein [Spirochaetaceae bacterium]